MVVINTCIDVTLDFHSRVGPRVSKMNSVNSAWIPYLGSLEIHQFFYYCHDVLCSIIEIFIIIISFILQVHIRYG